ncbi:MAG: lipopolysaccharide biosynthesis protein [Lachnospiraceae bacterium]|nr:lipopolysaccharide biosynthesis protein [Lachnospiraceae bacterium]
MRNFFINSKNIARDSYIWNMTGSMLNAFQSVIMLMIITRAVNLYEAGLFTIAYANANLFLTIGRYGMHNYQVSDVNKQYTFREYFVSRIITTILMAAISVLYVLYVSHTNSYTSEKSWIIIWMCALKLIDSIEDVYYAMYQQNHRLDISGKCMTIRMIFTIIVFGMGLIIYKRLLPALIVATITSAIAAMIFIHITYEDYKNSEHRVKAKNILSLLKVCFPLFLGTFLAFYIGNAPKYAIDSILNEELQACYGFIAMPVFIIGVLNNFIFNPVVAKMSLMWNEGEIKGFCKMLRRQLFIVVGIIAACELGAFLLGIPVLSLLYNTDLTPYKTELLILLLGGGFLATSGLMVTIITIMRKQTVLSIGYIIVSIVAFIASPIMVEKYSMMGAACLYTVLMFALCVMFGVPMVMEIRKKVNAP